MILDDMLKSLKELESKLRCSRNQKLKSYFIIFNQHISKSQQSCYLYPMIATAFIQTIEIGFDYQYFENRIIEQMQRFLLDRCQTNQTLTIKVSLLGYKEQLYRVMELPYMIKINEFCYCILAGFNVQECKPFSLMVDHVDKYSEEVNDSKMDCFLSDYDLERNSHLTLCYGYDKTYTFEIEVISIVDEPIDHLKFLEGKGYGVWEDAVDDLYMYYQDSQQFIKYISKKGLDIDDFYIEEFDLNKMNRDIIENIEFLKIGYCTRLIMRKHSNEWLSFYFVEKCCMKIFVFV